MSPGTVLAWALVILGALLTVGAVVVVVAAVAVGADEDAYRRWREEDRP